MSFFSKMSSVGGLGEGRLVELVVAVPAVAHDVDPDVGAPLVPVLDGGLEGGRARERVVAVAVEDGAPERLGNVGGVRGAAGVDRVGLSEFNQGSSVRYRAIATRLNHQETIV